MKCARISSEEGKVLNVMGQLIEGVEILQIRS